MPVNKKQHDRPLTAGQQALATDNMPLVWWHVNRYLRGFDQEVIEDAASCCMLGLVRAAQLFQPERKAARTGKPVRFGTYALWWIRCFFGRWMEKRVRQGSRKTVPFCLVERLDGEEWEPPDGKSLEAEREADLRDEAALVLSRLSARQRRVLELRCFEGLTLEQAGAALGVTKERVRQLEKRAKERARRLHPKLLGEIA